MSRCKKFICCCVSGNKESDLIASTKSHTDHDYLLPGGEWDPSLSTPPSQSHSSKKRHSTKELANSLERDGLYQPPALVPSPTLPTFDDFKLLKTVGRGAFGKVSLLCLYICTSVTKTHFYNHPYMYVHVHTLFMVMLFQVHALYFVQVLLCVHQSTRILYAMKVVPKAKISTQKQVTQILAESNILK